MADPLGSGSGIYPTYSPPPPPPKIQVKQNTYDLINELKGDSTRLNKIAAEDGDVKTLTAEDFQRALTDKSLSFTDQERDGVTNLKDTAEFKRIFGSDAFKASISTSPYGTPEDLANAVGMMSGNLEVKKA
jgi:hypothetical protein